MNEIVCHEAPSFSRCGQFGNDDDYRVNAAAVPYAAIIENSIEFLEDSWEYRERMNRGLDSLPLRHKKIWSQPTNHRSSKAHPIVCYERISLLDYSELGWANHQALVNLQVPPTMKASFSQPADGSTKCRIARPQRSRRNLDQVMRQFDRLSVYSLRPFWR